MLPVDERLRALSRSVPMTSGGFVLVPKSKTKLSVGGGIIPEEQDSGGTCPFPVDLLRKLGASPGRVILIDVDGDSMMPEIRDKDSVLINVNQTEVRDGKIFAIAVGDVVQVKQLQVVGPGRILIKSLNVAYRSYEVGIEELRIVGQVIWGARAYW
jgi:phage repressor protein C with HTH and peptisase S24 domain